MAKIPQVSRQELPSGQSGIGFIDPSVARTGTAAVEIALAGISQGLAGLGRTIDEIDTQRANTEFKNAQADTTLRLGKAELEARNAPDGETSHQIMNDAIKFEQSNAKTFGRRKTQELYANWFPQVGTNAALKGIVIGQDKDSAAGRQADIKAETALTQNVLTQEQIDEAVPQVEASLNESRENGNYAGQDNLFEKRFAATKDRLTFQAVQNNILRKDFATATELVKQSELPPDKKDSLLVEIGTKQSQQTGEQKKASKILSESSVTDMFESARNVPETGFTSDAVVESLKNPNMDAGVREVLEETLLRASNAQALSGTDIFIDVTDDTIVGNIETRIVNGEKINPNEMAILWGRGLNTDDITRLSALQEDTSKMAPSQKAIFKSGSDLITSLTSVAVNNAAASGLLEEIINVDSAKNNIIFELSQEIKSGELKTSTDVTTFINESFTVPIEKGFWAFFKSRANKVQAVGERAVDGQRRTVSDRRVEANDTLRALILRGEVGVAAEFKDENSELFE